MHGTEHLLTATSPGRHRRHSRHSRRSRGTREALIKRERILTHHSWAQLRRLDGIIERCLANARPARALALT
jgi:hypothetical protein